jgi:hypothetical protein
VVKIGQSLYREAPGNDPFRPDQKTPVKNFFLSGSYTKQVLLYIKNIDLATAINRPRKLMSECLEFVLTNGSENHQKQPFQFHGVWTPWNVFFLLSCNMQTSVGHGTLVLFVLYMQDYIDSMEGATLSGRRTSAYICGAGEELLALRKKLLIDDGEKALGNVQVLQASWTIPPALQRSLDLSNHTYMLEWTNQPTIGFSRFRVLAIPAATSCVSYPIWALDLPPLQAFLSYPWSEKQGVV